MAGAMSHEQKRRILRQGIGLEERLCQGSKVPVLPQQGCAPNNPHPLGGGGNFLPEPVIFPPGQQQGGLHLHQGEPGPAQLFQGLGRAVHQNARLCGKLPPEGRAGKGSEAGNLPGGPLYGLLHRKNGPFQRLRPCRAEPGNQNGVFLLDVLFLHIPSPAFSTHFTER